MPTTAQLDLLLESELEFGLNRNEYNVRGSSMAGRGTTGPTEFTGEVIGTIAYDPESGDLKITPFTDEEKKQYEEENNKKPSA